MGTPTQYKIGGCDVVFPHQAYGVQLSFMNKCVQSLEGGRNALLEAPTGRWSVEFHCKAKDKEPLTSRVCRLIVPSSSPARHHCRFWEDAFAPLFLPCLAAAREKADRGRATLRLSSVGCSPSRGAGPWPRHRGDTLGWSWGRASCLCHPCDLCCWYQWEKPRHAPLLLAVLLAHLLPSLCHA